MVRRLLFSLCLVSTLLCGRTGAAGKLQQVRDKTSYQNNPSTEEEDPDSCGFFQMLFSSCPTPEERRREEVIVVAQQQQEAASTARKRAEVALRESLFYLPYPYYQGHAGNMVRVHLPREQLIHVDECSPEYAGVCQSDTPIVACIGQDCYQAKPGEDVQLPAYARELGNGRLQLFADVGRDLDGLWRTTLGGYLGATGLFALDTRWTLWVEPMGGGQFDHFWLGDLNVHLQFFRLPALTWSVGIGPRLLADSNGSTAGVNGTTRIDLYPISPLVLHLEADVGNLGSAFVYEGQGSAGVMLGRTEVYAGGSWLQIADTRFPSLFAGLRVHL